LSLCCYSVRDPVEILGPDKNDRATRESITWIGASIVLANARREIVSSWASNLERRVRAAEHVNVYAHSDTIL